MWILTCFLFSRKLFVLCRIVILNFFFFYEMWNIGRMSIIFIGSFIKKNIRNSVKTKIIKTFYKTTVIFFNDIRRKWLSKTSKCSRYANAWHAYKAFDDNYPFEFIVIAIAVYFPSSRMHSVIHFLCLCANLEFKTL